MSTLATLKPRLGRVRWRICAMLFVATSINYMDRQVIGLLKPTLEHNHRASPSPTSAASSPPSRWPTR